MTPIPADPLRRLQLVSLNAVAELLGVSRRTIYRRIAAGKFPAPVKVGARTQIRLDDLERYIERQQRKAGG